MNFYFAPLFHKEVSLEQHFCLPKQPMALAWLLSLMCSQIHIFSHWDVLGLLGEVSIELVLSISVAEDFLLSITGWIKNSQDSIKRQSKAN